MAKKTVVPEGKERVRVAPGVYRKRSGRKRFIAMYTDPGGRQRWKAHETQHAAEWWRAEGRFHPERVAQGKRRLDEVWADFRRHFAFDLKSTTWNDLEEEFHGNLTMSENVNRACKQPEYTLGLGDMLGLEHLY